MVKLFEQYLIGKELLGGLQQLKKRGGLFARASDQVKDVLVKISYQHENPFEELKITNNGEHRLKHCIKFDLAGAARLVTIQDNGVCLIAFVGDHSDTDAWLEAKRGLSLTIDTKNRTLVPIRISENINKPEERINTISDFSEGLLYKKLKDYYFNKIEVHFSGQTKDIFLQYDSTVDENELWEACQLFPSYELQSMFFDVFHELKAGNVEEAQNRILKFEHELKLVSDATPEEVESIEPSDQYISIRELEAEYLKGILDTKNWYEWMVFLHPDQKRIVHEEFSGSARLLGVSGSGKTSVLVHRAVKLAQKDPDKPILILTLNESLARLINKLVDVLLEAKGQPNLRTRIIVSSFWQICRDHIIKLNSPSEFTSRILSPITDKTNETIDEIWEEFYYQKLNNNDAKVLFPVHQTLLSRGIWPVDYLRQEFDWIRSAFSLNNRDEYLSVEREGRFIPLSEGDRKSTLAGLGCWEDKMKFVGAIDYLGLSSLLHLNLDSIEPMYSSIFVDEAQDFGTLELQIIRQLVAVGENDLFLCGDIAQQVYNKQHKLKRAGITILPEGYLKILKNYRNSREILQAAYAVFENNVDEEKLRSEDFEVLNPEFANFSSPKPFIRMGESLEQEFSSGIAYLKETLNQGKTEKGCIAVCGISLFDLTEISDQCGIPILSGNNDLSEGDIFLSDLEQTKGFEFDKMIVVNCRDSVFPNKSLPSEEWHREISKLYVAMTRAKKELTISYSGMYSKVFENCLDYFTLDKWSDHIQHPVTLDFDFKDSQDVEFEELNFTGYEFLYTQNAKGLSRELQNKLIELVAGKTVSDQAGKIIGWRSIEDLKQDVIKKRDLPTINKVFGAPSLRELEEFFSKPQSMTVK